MPFFLEYLRFCDLVVSFSIFFGGPDARAHSAAAPDRDDPARSKYIRYIPLYDILAAAPPGAPYSTRFARRAKVRF
jgi:hypothetical protein